MNTATKHQCHYDAIFRDQEALLGAVVDDQLHAILDGGAVEYPVGWSARHYGESGGLAIVYRYRTRQTRRKAIRCWSQPFHETNLAKVQARFATIASYFHDPTRSELAALTVPFRFFPRAIEIPSAGSFPALVMDWVEGSTLLEYVDERSRAEDRQSLRALAHQWRDLLRILDAAGVEHGDLAATNVMITAKRQLKLIDYDFVNIRPLSLESPTGWLGGQPGYRHPDVEFRGLPPTKQMDCFAGLVIHAALTALAALPRLWPRWTDFDRCGFPRTKQLLFRPIDFMDPDRSPLFDDLERIADWETTVAVAALREACYRRLSDLTSPMALLEEAVAPIAPPMTAQIRNRTLCVTWDWPDDSTVEAVALAWSPHEPPEEPRDGDDVLVIDRATHDHFGGALIVPLDCSPPAQLHVSLFAVPLPGNRQYSKQPSTVRLLARAIASTLCRVESTLETHPAHPIVSLIVRRRDGQPLPKLVVVRRIARTPAAIFGHQRIAVIDTTGRQVRDQAILTWNSVEERALLPPNSVLRVFPADPHDDAWVQVEGRLVLNSPAHSK